MNIFEDLLAQPQKSGVAPEVLEMLGRKAAEMYKKGVPLNDAVTQVTSGHPGLGNEHVKRVVEFANTVTFQELFQNSEDKNIHFAVADPGVVLRDLKDGGSPAHDGKTLHDGMGDYRTPPKESGMPDEVEQLFDGQFVPREGDIEHTKEASALDHAHHSNPLEDVHDTHLRLQAAREKLAEVHESFTHQLSASKGDFYQAVKHEILDPDGAGLGGVLGALEKFASHDVLGTVLSSVTEDLLREIPADVLTASLHKRAGKVVNLQHPVVQHFAGMAKLAHEVVRSQEALEEVDGHLEKTAGALTSAVKGAIRPRGKVPSGIRQRFGKK